RLTQGRLAHHAGVPAASVAPGPIRRREPISVVDLDEKVPRCDEVDADSGQQLPFLRRPRRELDPVEEAGIGQTEARRILYSPIPGDHDAVAEGVAAVDIAASAQTGGAWKLLKRGRGNSAPAGRRGFPN